MMYNSVAINANVMPLLIRFNRGVCRFHRLIYRCLSKELKAR